MPFANTLRQTTQLIRAALIVGVLTFGAAILLVQRQPGWKPTSLPPAASYALLAYAIATIPIVMATRGRVMGEPDPQRRVSFLVAGWAFGEGAGLFGGALFLLTGQSQWYLIGLAAMICVFGLLRIRIEP